MLTLIPIRRALMMVSRLRPKRLQAIRQAWQALRQRSNSTQLPVFKNIAINDLHHSFQSWQRWIDCSKVPKWGLLT